MDPLKINKAIVDNKNIFIVDNFFEAPEIYRNFAIQSESFYNHPMPGVDNWLGFRCDIAKEFTDNDLTKKLIKKLSELVFPFFKLSKFNTEGELFFHYGPKICQDLVGDFFHQYSLHKDQRAICAGVIYLTPDPPDNTGTCFSDGAEVYVVENVYNRLVFYDSSITHGVENLFGEDILDSRLVITFFFWNKQSIDVDRFYNDTDFSKLI